MKKNILFASAAVLALAFAAPAMANGHNDNDFSNNTIVVDVNSQGAFDTTQAGLSIAATASGAASATMVNAANLSSVDTSVTNCGCAADNFVSGNVVSASFNHQIADDTLQLAGAVALSGKGDATAMAANLVNVHSVTVSVGK